MYECFNFPITLVIFYCSHPSGCEVISYYGLVCISLKYHDVEHFFLCLFIICFSSLGMSIYIHCLSLKLGYLSFLLLFLYIFWIQLFIRFANISFHSNVYLNFLGGVLCDTKVFKFDEIQFIYFSFYGHSLYRYDVIFRSDLPKPQTFIPVFF